MRRYSVLVLFALATFVGCSHDPEQSFKERFLKAAEKESAHVDEWPDPDEQGFRVIKHRVDIDTVKFEMRKAETPAAETLAVVECQIESGYGPRAATAEQAQASVVEEWKKGTGPTMFRYMLQNNKWILVAIERFFDNPNLGMNGWVPIAIEDDLVEALKLDGVDLEGKATK